MSNDDVLTRLSSSLADRYRIERELGAGGMATVFLAHDLRHGRDVAIKVLHPDLGAALGDGRFLSEIRTTARLQHPHVLPLLDSGSAHGLLYYVMPVVTGETLRARLAREKQLPVDDAVRIASEVADALGYAHELGVIHRDIKPENILLQGGHATVADFGIALAVQQAGGHHMTQTGLSLGTPQYMSSEQAMGERAIDARSDLYSLAAVTYEMLIGEPPFTGPTVQSILARVMTDEPRPMVPQRKAIPDHVEFAVMRGLEKLPADRWGSAREFASALQSGSSVSHGGAATTRQRAESPARISWKTRLRDPLVLTLAAVADASAAFAFSSRPRFPRESTEVVRFTIPALTSDRANSLGYATLAISPDGRSLVYVGLGDDKRPQLMFVRSMTSPFDRSGNGRRDEPDFLTRRQMGRVRTQQSDLQGRDRGQQAAIARAGAGHLRRNELVVDGCHRRIRQRHAVHHPGIGGGNLASSPNPIAARGSSTSSRRWCWTTKGWCSMPALRAVPLPFPSSRSRR